MERQITPYEKLLMEYLDLHSLKALEDFLGHPSWGCLDMQPPGTNEEALEEDRWQEKQEAA